MIQFNKIEFGEKLKSARIKKGYPLEYVAKMLGRTPSTISRYENGEIIPNAKIINKLCDILDIYYADLYIENEEKIVNIEKSKNPFKVSKVYLYYLGYVTKTNIDVFKLVINFKEKNNYVEVTISNYDTKKIILKGHIIADDFIATIRTENYKPNYPRLETNQIILNISGGTEGLVRGMMFSTNGEYIPSAKKVVVSKKDFTVNNDVIEYLKLDEEEKKKILKNDIWQGNISRE